LNAVDIATGITFVVAEKKKKRRRSRFFETALDGNKYPKLFFYTLGGFKIEIAENTLSGWRTWKKQKESPPP